jgi:hypothetical protein
VSPTLHLRRRRAGRSSRGAFAIGVVVTLVTVGTGGLIRSRLKQRKDRVTSLRQVQLASAHDPALPRRGGAVANNNKRGDIEDANRL